MDTWKGIGFTKKRLKYGKETKNDNAGSVIPIKQSGVIEGRADHGTVDTAVVWVSKYASRSLGKEPLSAYVRKWAVL